MPPKSTQSDVELRNLWRHEYQSQLQGNACFPNSMALAGLEPAIFGSDDQAKGLLLMPCGSRSRGQDKVLGR
jgi:hypothetical protein